MAEGERRAAELKRAEAEEEREENTQQVLAEMSALAAIYKAMLGSSNAPTVHLTTIPDGVRLTVTDINGSKSADILNGTKGDKGDDGDQGEQGPQGRGIVGVEKTSESGVVKTYTITMSDGATFTFTVKDGQDGAPGEKGDKGDKGEGFSISKTYASVEEMNAGFSSDSVPINGFVLINTGNVDDEDNAKLFVKLSDGYSYLTDLSGPQGIKGDKGDQGDKGDPGTPGTPGENGTSAYHYWDGTTLTITSAGGTSSANLKGDKGDKGDDGGLTPEQEALLAVIPDLKKWYDKEHYTELAFVEGSISPNNAGATFEMGTDLYSNVVEYSWKLNKTPTLLKVDDSSISVETTSYTKSYYSTSQTKTTFTIYAEFDGKYGKETVSKDYTYYFRNKVYYGVLAESTINDAFILELTSQFATTYEHSGFNGGDGSADKYIWYCFPKRFENSQTPTFTLGGYQGGFIKLTEYGFTNSHGFKETYSIYRSTNKGVGKSIVTVS